MTNVNNGLFIQMSTKTGDKYVNITSIALIEATSHGCVVTLKEKDVKGNNIIFEVTIPYGSLTASLHDLIQKS